MTASDQGSPADKTITYTSYVVFRRSDSSEQDGAALARELGSWATSVEAAGVTIRGFYDVTGMREDADLMVWIIGPTAETLQSAARSLRRTVGTFGLIPRWSVVGLARESEFNKSHIPAFIEGKRARNWLTVYPFVRSHEWFLLGAHERSALLTEHGMLGRDFPGVLTNTVSSFALGDYEFLVGIECDELDRTVDMMRALRASASRRHVRLETPFFTGRRTEVGEIGKVLE